MIDLTEAIVFVERYYTDLRWEGVHEMVCGECAACSVSRALQKARQDQRRQEATIAALLAVPDDLGNGSLPTISIKDRVRDALALHYDDDFGRCVLCCDELWPCETVQLLGPIGRSTR